MVSTFGHHPWTVDDLVSGVDMGTIRLPDIQRPFVWPNAKIRDLIDSMYRGYPVGELMFWASKDPANTKEIGAAAKTQAVSMQVVDGQQRLTSLYAVIKGAEVWREDYSREAVKLAFNPLTERFEVPNSSTRRSPEWINDIVGVFADAIEARHRYLRNLRNDSARTVDSEIERQVEIAIQQVASLRSYAFQVVQLKEEVSRETVAEIFVRTNSEGVNLSSADFILTWMSVFWEEGRRELDTWARNSRFTPSEVTSILNEKTIWTPKNPYTPFDPGQVLRVAIAVGLRRAKLQDAYNVLRGRDPRTRLIHPERREKELARLQTGQGHAIKPVHWDEFLRVLERAGFRSRAMITSVNTILYSYALWLVGRIDFGVPVDELREVMARWFFMSQLTGRYTNSPETRMQEDLNRLDGLQPVAAEFIKVLNNQIDAAVPEDWWRVTLSENLDTSSVNAPAFAGYVAALNILDADVLLATSKVKDWINPAHASVKGIEKHHLFPRDYLKSALGVRDTRKINQVANYALVEWSDNVAISNQPPNVYWPQEVAEKNIDAARRKRQEGWHALPGNWFNLGYEEFLQQRRQLMANVVHEGFKRLTDPNYEPSFTQLEGALETMPAAVTLPTFEHLVSSGTLPPGTLLTPVDPDRPTIAEVIEDGYIQVGEHLCETVDRAAREDHAEAGSGWEYWQAHLDDEDEPVTLADLRERAAAASP
ncbi:GmrSD restriction endonuclease domain-containing protein [Actinomadura welshii]